MTEETVGLRGRGGREGISVSAQEEEEEEDGGAGQGGQDPGAEEGEGEEEVLGGAVLDKVDRILELKKEREKKKYSEGRMMKKVDKILFSDISSSVSKEERTM